MTTNTVARMESFFLRYISMQPEYAFVASLWTVGTYLWENFDAFGYVTITAETKRAGKTRFMELIGMLARNAMSATAPTPATVFLMIKNLKPVLLCDEAEKLSSESNELRPILNTGYRAGQSVPRVRKGTQEIDMWPVYCPKVFVLIGDTNDTLNDRSIVFRMVRGKVDQRFTFAEANPAATELRGDISKLLYLPRDRGALESAPLQLTDTAVRIVAEYQECEQLTFLSDRDAELWTSLFAICSVIAPSRMKDLRRIAVDMSTMKTQERRKYTDMEMKNAESTARDSEYSERLLRDLLLVIGNEKHIYTVDAIPALHALPEAPWRVFRGKGLNDIDMGNLLSAFVGVEPKAIRSGKKGTKTERVARGYRREEVAAAVKRLG